MKHKYGNMPNNSKGNRSSKLSDAGPGGTNQGATGGLRKENPQRADVTAKPTTTNRYPNGLS